jgi:hypothetical protein
MKFCPTCGSTLRDGARFCENCGAATMASPAAPVPPPAAAAPAPAQPPAAPETAQLPSAAATATLPPAGAPPRVEPPAGSADDAGQPSAGPRRSRRGLLTGIGGVAAVGVLGVVGYVVFDQLSGPSGGADSPQAAVTELSAAANAEDAVTALSLLPPGEVGPIVDLYRDVEAKATSTGVADEEKPFAGFDVRLDGVKVQSEELGEDVAAVTVTSGTVSWTLDPDQLQGALRVEPSGDLREAAEGSADLVEVSREATDGSPLRIMTVQQDGKWYVSPTYTLLEAWRVNQGLPAPDFSKELDLEGTGADSATAAVEQAAQAVAAYDVDGLLDLLSPDEASALYRYRDAITAALHRDGALAELQSEGQLAIDSVDVVAADEVDGRVPVTVRSASGGLYDDDRDYTSWSLDRNCLSYNEDGDTDGGCLDEVFDEMGLGADLAANFESLTILTQEVDGRWYLSPMATVVSEVRGVVTGLDADDVAAMLDVRQFGGVDGRLEDGATLDGTSGDWSRPALYEMEVPAGSVFSTCVEGDALAYLYGPDGRPTGEGAVLATDGGRYRVAVSGPEGEETSFSISPVLSSVEEISVPTTVAAEGGDSCGSRLLSFEATAGEPLLFGAEGGSNVQITTPSGENVWTTAFVPEETGTHFIAVGAQQEVSIETLAGDVLTIGDTTTVSVPEDGEAVVRVFVAEGEDVRISVDGNSPNIPIAQLTTLDGTFVDESIGSYFEAARVYSDRDSEVFELVVEDYWGGAGSFTVSVGQY